ncbi:hypothetical protein DSO57_1034366 [Entomophthora muscae]|uniref:Uncharacterized protein n=1 Tax=Entomophthora muscae TaxID=34485 RepID=A0ACC2UAM9_9FUNG|nr:hypothetical protein DSO57_1034366 [Entomophthora muscae]
MKPLTGSFEFSAQGPQVYQFWFNEIVWKRIYTKWHSGMNSIDGNEIILAKKVALSVGGIPNGFLGYNMK